MTDKIYSHELDKDISARDLLRGLSASDFLNFGIQDVAYVKEVKLEGKPTFAIHAADGTPLSLVESKEEAIELIKDNDLETIQIQ